MEIKRFERAMINEVVSLFKETILTINIKNYSKEQVEAWANNTQTVDKWVGRLEKGFAYVAIIDGKIGGFGNLTEDGLIDLLYVHKNHQAGGIGSAIVSKLEVKAKQQNMMLLSTDASISAKPFFLAHDYQVVEEQTKRIDGVSLTNFKMIKNVS